MTDWTPEIEALIRKLGDFIDQQMRDLLDYKSSAWGSALRIAFNVATTGKPLVQKTCKAAGIEYNGDILDAMKKIVAVADQNKSDAADKIKKALPYGEEFAVGFDQTATTPKFEDIKKVKEIKSRKIDY